MADRVLQEVREHALEQPRVGPGRVGGPPARRPHRVTRAREPRQRRRRSTSSSATATGCTLSAPAFEPTGVEQIRHDRVEAVRRLLDRRRAARRAARPTTPTSVCRSAADRRLDARKGRAEIVADGGEQGGSLAVGRGQLARLARAVPTAAGPRRRSRAADANACSTRWSSANSAGPRPISLSSLPIGTSKRSRASSPGRAQPAVSTSTHSPAGCAGRSARRTPCQTSSARHPAHGEACRFLEVAACKTRQASPLVVPPALPRERAAQLPPPPSSPRRPPRETLRVPGPARPAPPEACARASTKK